MVLVVSVVSRVPFDPLFRFRPHFRPHVRLHVRSVLLGVRLYDVCCVVCFGVRFCFCSVLLGVRLHDVCCVVRCGVRFRAPCFVRYRCVR